MSPWVCSDSCPLSQRCHATISYLNSISLFNLKESGIRDWNLATATTTKPKLLRMIFFETLVDRKREKWAIANKHYLNIYSSEILQGNLHIWSIESSDGTTIAFRKVLWRKVISLLVSITSVWWWINGSCMFVGLESPMALHENCITTC